MEIDNPEFPPEEFWPELLELSTSLQRFIRENFGLYHNPDVDYRALRAENLRRTAQSRSRP